MELDESEATKYLLKLIEIYFYTRFIVYPYILTKFCGAFYYHDFLL